MVVMRGRGSGWVCGEGGTSVVGVEVEGEEGSYYSLPLNWC